jgi:hypothetical protein
MNRLRLFLFAFLALASGGASAVSLNGRGLGQVLVYPYYTVNKGQDTLLTLGNETDAGKAVVVRVLEAYNGRELLTFNLFLSPHDVWTASISQLADDGGGAMKTSDRSCTDPAFPAVTSVPLETIGFDGSGSVPADAGPQTVTRTREGSIEVIQMGDIDPTSELATATTHVLNGQPNGGAAPCGITAAIVGSGVVAPTGGLFGSASIVNVGEGTFFAYNASALQGFSDRALNSSTVPPTLQDANSSELPTGAIAYVLDANGRPLALSYELGVDAVSAVFMADSIQNEFIAGGGLGANTDWIVTFPTKRFYTDPRYGASVRSPFVEQFRAPGQSNVLLNVAIHDREEGRSTYFDGCNGCPGVPLPILAYEVNVVSFLSTPAQGSVSGVFGSNLAYLNILPFGEDGYVALDLASGDGETHSLPGGVDAQGMPVVLRGLPVAGFMAYNIINSNAQPGMLANYGGAFPHRTTFSCVGGQSCSTALSGD